MRCINDWIYWIDCESWAAAKSPVRLYKNRTCPALEYNSTCFDLVSFHRHNNTRHCYAKDTVPVPTIPSTGPTTQSVNMPPKKAAAAKKTGATSSHPPYQVSPQIAFVYVATPAMAMARSFHRLEHRLTIIHLGHDQGGCHQCELTCCGALLWASPGASWKRTHQQLLPAQSHTELCKR